MILPNEDKYSTTEKAIGITEDGNILYRKTYSNYTISEGTNYKLIVLESGATNKWIRNAYGILSGYDNSYCIPAVDHLGGCLFSNVLKNNANGDIYLITPKTTDLTGWVLSITVEYVKT